MVSDGAMTLQEELTQTNPLQEALQYSQKTITERAFALEDSWKRTPPVEGFSEDNFYSRANLLLVRDAGISEHDLFSISQRVVSARTVMPSGISGPIWKKTIMLWSILCCAHRA